MPNKKFCLSQNEGKIRILDYLKNKMTAQHYFWNKYGIYPPVINGDLMSLLRYHAYIM